MPKYIKQNLVIHMCIYSKKGENKSSSFKKQNK